MDNNNALSGFLWSLPGFDQFNFVDYKTIVETTTKNNANCDDGISLLVQMFFYIELYEFKSVPHQSISRYLQETSNLECPLKKCGFREIVGQYIEYINGEASAVVSYGYTIYEECDSGASPFGDRGGPGSGGDDDNDGEDDPNGGNSNSNGDDDNEEEEKTPAQILREFIVDECGFEWADFGRLNVAAGAAFEDAVLRSYGVEQNTQLFDSPVRENITDGAFLRVQPDFVDDGVYVSEDGSTLAAQIEYSTGINISDEVHIYPDATFGEVKAYSSTVYLSTSNNQIIGEIDALAEEFSFQADPSNGTFKPSYYLFTLGPVSDEIATYCTERGVQFFHVKMNIDERNRVETKAIVMKNNEAGELALSLKGYRVDLKCPPNSPSNRLDPEILDGQ